MRELLATTFVTLDGVMQAPGGPGEDDSRGFAWGGWSAPYWDETMMEAMGAFASQPFSMVLGRKTYDIMAAHWPHASEAEGAGVFNNATKYVASREPLGELAWQNSEQLQGDVAEALFELKKQDGPQLQVHGSSDLLQTLLRHEGLIDVMQMWIFPVVVGGGKRLFENGVLPMGLELVDHKVSGTGVMLNTYKPSGPVPIGSFELE